MNDQTNGSAVLSFPRHKAGLSLQHNDHLNVYETARQWIEDFEDLHPGMLEWSSADARQRCIDTNEIWHLHWYPSSPVGFDTMTGPTCEEVLAAACAMQDDEGGDEGGD
jgi:hypothetical protein